ncbi:hypothetical protein [Daejeonella sp. H1SJ63]|jgi:beta-lactamase regulating signal transducer with metallopeptidase domain|uniref:hypothetical protein n=1 Tax=Daejeonella sp. H1SJ63 TaxID=3034145 RepID=UPI0023EA7EB4|nr:hypothetical protein [Daejeonella sp. H1SJ63]
MEDSLNNNSTAEANNPSHYTTITLGIIIGLTGIFLRFTGESSMISIISNVLWVVGSVICLRAVLKILK